MTPGRIAAIVTCHDLGRTLDEALESVYRQTRPAAEIIVVDGASTDLFTRQRMSLLQRQGTLVVRTETPGASAARNLGARTAGADYLICLDADDLLEPGYFEAAASRLDAQPGLDFVSCAMRAFGAASYVWSPPQPSFVESISTGAVPHASTMLRRAVWRRLGGFDEELQSFELLDFWATAIERGCRGIILDEAFLRYRVRAGSGYRRSLRAEVYRARMRHFYEKHRETVERLGLDLIERKEAFFLEQRDYLHALEGRQRRLEEELAELQRSVARVSQRLAAQGMARVEMGDLNRPAPVSTQWGRDRGQAIDRRYIESFLDTHRRDVRGRVLEVRDSTYTTLFGGASVTAADVLDIDPSNAQATIVADLRRADEVPSGSYDCIILTQTLQLVDDIAAAIREAARMLRPGGTLLATVPTTIRVDDEAGRDGDFWRLTEASARKLFADTFPLDAFEVTAYGNVLACTAFLYGMSVEEMDAADLDRVDPDYPLVIGVRAVKPKAVVPKVVQTSRSAGAILVYHRVAELAPDSHDLCTPPAVFREHMMRVRDEFHPIGLEALVEAAACGRIPERALAVTFDDGYLDALTTASPILMEFGIPATFFVNTDRLDEEHERWWDLLEYALSNPDGVPTVLELTVGGQRLVLPTATAGQRTDALIALNRAAWPLGAVAREEMAQCVAAWSGIDRRPRATHRVMTGRELRALADRPRHTVGAHTTHHLALTTVTRETKRREIVENKEVLERLLDRPVQLFSYPYGEFDAETVDIVGAAGFHAAVTVEPRMVAAGTNRLLLPRHEIGRRQGADFSRHLMEMLGACPVSP